MTEDKYKLREKREEYAKLLQWSLQKIVDKLSPKAERISVFGSYLKKPPDLFTDLDVLIIMKTKKPFLERLTGIYSQLCLPVDADILCYTPEEFALIKNRRFFKKILSEETVLYEKRRDRRRKKVA